MQHLYTRFVSARAVSPIGACRRVRTAEYKFPSTVSITGSAAISYFSKCCTAVGNEMMWLNGWTFRKQCTLAKPKSNLTDFPFYIVVSEDSDIGKHARHDGRDIRFTASDSSTLLSYECLEFTVNDGAAAGADL